MNYCRLDVLYQYCINTMSKNQYFVKLYYFIFEYQKFINA